MSDKVLDEKTLVALIPLAKNGDNSAYQRIFRSVKNFIHQVANKHCFGDKQQQEELYSEGTLGFVEATQDFDVTRNVKFITFLGWKVKGRIKNYIRSNHSIIRTMTTENYRKVFWRLPRETAKLRAKGITDRDVIRATVAQILDVPIQDVIETEQRTNSPVKSLDARSVEAGTTGKERHEVTPDNQLDPQETYERKEQAEAMRIAMNSFADTLEGTELDIWIYRVDSIEPMSLTEVGMEVGGVSKQYVGKVEKKLMTRFTKFAHTQM